MNSHKEILADIKRRVEEDENFMDALNDLWLPRCDTNVKYNTLDTNDGLKVTLLSEQITGYDEGNVYTQKVYDINGLTFVREECNNSWGEYYEISDFLPARAVEKTITVYEVIDE